MAASGFTALEIAALSAIFALYPDLENSLKRQVEHATVTSREFTGVGSFTKFDVDRAAGPSAISESPLGTVEIKVGSEGYPLNFMVFATKDGWLETLESYSFLDGYDGLDLMTAAFGEPATVRFNDQVEPSA